MVLAIFLCVNIGNGKVKAADKPEVYMYPSLCIYRASFNNLELDVATKHQTWSAIYSRLQQLETEGQLPFSLRMMTPEGFHKVNEMQEETRIVLIPTVMVSAAMDTSTNGEEQALYNSTVVNGLSLMLCVVEENYDIEKMSHDGHNSASYRIVGNVPLVKAQTIGLVEVSQGVVDDKDLRHEPVSQEEKLRCFQQLSQELMREKISFKNVKKHIRNQDVAFDPETYQVTKVNTSSQKLREFFSEDQLKELSFLAGYYYTAAYQQRTGRIVLPPAVSNRLNSQVVSAVSAMTLDSPAGELSVTVAAPQHPIQLDISGVAYKAVPQGNWYTLLHRVWLAKTPAEGREKCELDRISQRQVWVPEGIRVEFDSRDVLTRLIMGLAQELGYQRL